MLARDLMTPQPALCTGRDTVQRAADLMRTRNVGMLPVVDDLAHRHLIGILTDRDIAVRHVAPGHGPDAKVRDHMTREPLTWVGPGMPVETVLAQMEQHQVRRLPVVDELGYVIGVIAQADIVRQLGPTDPERVEHLLERISRPGALVA